MFLVAAISAASYYLEWSGYGVYKKTGSDGVERLVFVAQLAQRLITEPVRTPFAPRLPCQVPPSRGRWVKRVLLHVAQLKCSAHGPLLCCAAPALLVRARDWRGVGRHPARLRHCRALGVRVGDRVCAAAPV